MRHLKLLLILLIACSCAGGGGEFTLSSSDGIKCSHESLILGVLKPGAEHVYGVFEDGVLHIQPRTINDDGSYQYWRVTILVEKSTYDGHVELQVYDTDTLYSYLTNGIWEY